MMLHRLHEGPAPGVPERASHAATATVSSKMAGAAHILERLAYTTLTEVSGFQAISGDAGTTAPATDQAALSSSVAWRAEPRRDTTLVFGRKTASASRSSLRTRRAIRMAFLMFGSGESSSKNSTTSQVTHWRE